VQVKGALERYSIIRTAPSQHLGQEEIKIDPTSMIDTGRTVDF
jgi:hypothetical protein